MEKLGTRYGGWFIPTDIKLNKESIVYSAGVGEDISFDLSLNDKYNCHIYLIDPTLKAKKHYREVLDYYGRNTPFTGNIQDEYYEHIQNLKPDFRKIVYIEKGLWNATDRLKFYKQSNPEYVSQSLIEGMFGDDYYMVEVDSVHNIMKKHGHSQIDLFKLDIEGSEILVLEKMFSDGIFPRYICVEFDLLLKKKDSQGLTEQLIATMITEHQYQILANENFNITFEKQ